MRDELALVRRGIRFCSFPRGLIPRVPNQYECAVSMNRTSPVLNATGLRLAVRAKNLTTAHCFSPTVIYRGGPPCPGLQFRCFTPASVKRPRLPNR